MNKITPEQFGARPTLKEPTPEQIAATQAFQAQVIANRAKFLPMVGKTFTPKIPGPRPETFKVIEFIASLPMNGGRGVRPAFRIERSPIPGVHFDDVESFLAAHDEVIEPTQETNEPAAAPAAE